MDARREEGGDGPGSAHGEVVLKGTGVALRHDRALLIASYLGEARVQAPGHV